jgi:hypothetical protein
MIKNFSDFLNENDTITQALGRAKADRAYQKFASALKEISTVSDLVESIGKDRDNRSFKRCNFNYQEFSFDAYGESHGNMEISMHVPDKTSKYGFRETGWINTFILEKFGDPIELEKKIQEVIVKARTWEPPPGKEFSKRIEDFLDEVQKITDSSSYIPSLNIADAKVIDRDGDTVLEGEKMSVNQFTIEIGDFENSRDSYDIQMRIGFNLEDFISAEIILKKQGNQPRYLRDDIVSDRVDPDPGSILGAIEDVIESVRDDDEDDDWDWRRR